MSDIAGIDKTRVSVCTLRRLSHSLSPDPSWSPHVDHLAIPNNRRRFSDAPPHTPAKTEVELGLPLPKRKPLAKLPQPAQCYQLACTHLRPGDIRNRKYRQNPDILLCLHRQGHGSGCATRQAQPEEVVTSESVSQSLDRLSQPVNQQSTGTAIPRSSAARAVACHENGRCGQPAGVPGMGLTQAALIFQL